MSVHGDRHNWAGNHRYAAGRVAHPRSVEEVQALVAGSDRVHAVGTRHSFNGAADTIGVQVSLDALEVPDVVDAAARTVAVAAGTTYAELAPRLHAEGLALRNLASLPHITVGGACATATHGSGLDNGNLATEVVALEVVDGTGEVVRRSRDEHPDEFPGWVVALGALGVVTRVTLALVPAEPHHQLAYCDLSADRLGEDLDRVMGAARSVSCFTRWRDRTVDTVLCKDVGDPADAPTSLLGAPVARRLRGPVPGDETPNLTAQLGVPGPWYERLPHFRPDHVPASGQEVQSEWFVARADAPAALEAMWSIGGRLRDALMVSELRTVAADDLWLSPAHGRDVLGIHCTWHPDPALYEPAVDVVETALAAFAPTPHWGKVFHAGRDVWGAAHRRVGDFRALAARHDPDGRLHNEHLLRHVL